LVGVSLKSYLGYADTEAWLAKVASAVPDDRLFVLPSAPALPAARRLLDGTGVRYGAQNVHYESGPFTGEISAAMVVELGGTLCEVGHAERRALFGETDEIVARKMTAIARAGLIPVLCVGERELGPGANAFVRGQVRAALTGFPATAALIVAYEPVWAIGVERPADPAHVARITGLIRRELAGAGHARAHVLYGGSAGTGTFTALARAAGTPDELPDGLFLGRSAHDVPRLAGITEEIFTSGEDAHE
jgi:triosephosphate isomerase